MSLKKLGYSLRLVKDSDSNSILHMANDPSLRENSIQKHSITLKEHQNWFKKKLTDPECTFFVLVDNFETPLGYSRFQFSQDTTYIISVYLSQKLRGKGIGSMLIEESTNKFLKTHLKATIVAQVFHQNLRSFNSFNKSGFTHIKTIKHQNREFFELIKNSNSQTENEK